MKLLIKIINEEINSFVGENDDYHGEHQAPSTDDAPLHDITQTYPEDIYSSDAARMYGHYGDYRDQQAIGIIQSARNKPNKPIKIYRAVPDINHDLNTKLKPLLDIVNYHGQWNRFPMKNEIIYGLQDKYSINNHSYDEQQKLMLNDINNQIKNLQSQQQKPIGINAGDWVTIVRDYAKEHGQYNLGNKFKIISKTVPAKTLYSEGNDIFEWGYQPN